MIIVKTGQLKIEVEDEFLWKENARHKPMIYLHRDRRQLYREIAYFVVDVEDVSFVYE